MNATVYIHCVVNRTVIIASDQQNIVYIFPNRDFLHANILVSTHGKITPNYEIYVKKVFVIPGGKKSEPANFYIWPFSKIAKIA